MDADLFRAFYSFLLEVDIEQINRDSHGGEPEIAAVPDCSPSYVSAKRYSSPRRFRETSLIWSIFGRSAILKNRSSTVSSNRGSLLSSIINNKSESEQIKYLSSLSCSPTLSPTVSKYRQDREALDTTVRLLSSVTATQLYERDFDKEKFGLADPAV